MIIRRSQRHEGERLIAIWCRAVDATHEFLSVQDRAEIEVQVRGFIPEAPLWVAVNDADAPIAFMLLSDVKCLAAHGRVALKFVEVVEVII